MRKLGVYPKSAFDFYKEVVAAKRNTAEDPNYKTRLGNLEGTIRPLFQNYDNNFAGNTLELLAANALNGVQRDDLLRLYSYRSAILQKLKIQLTTFEFNKVMNTCQCCTIGEVGSFDHIVPKEEFPEFSVNPKNLFPSCPKCNGYKSAVWRVGGARTFLNLFLDDLPPQQYLFADVTSDQAGVASVNFTVRNINGINANTYGLLNSHYTKLHLCDRFKENSDGVIMKVVNGIRTGRNSLEKEAIVDQIVANGTANQTFFGRNYWQSILEISLANNATFIDAIYDAA